MSVLSILLMVLPLTLIPTLRHRTAHQVFNQDLDAAESGIDAVLGKLMTSHSYSAGPDVPTTVKTNGWSSITAEDGWARSTLTSLATNSVNRVTTPTGEYVAIRPASLQIVYSIGYMPNYAHASRVRVLKADYAYRRGSANSALLTSGDLAMSGSMIITTSSGEFNGSAVHTNGNITSNGSSSNTITGTVEAVGTNQYPAGISGAPAQDIPTIDPRYLYTNMQPYYSSAWYDLCPDGNAHQGSSTGVPCTGSNIGSLTGWSYNGGAWTESSGGPPGIYYAYRADVNLKMQGAAVTQTIITESSNNLGCPKTDGSISVSKTEVNAFLPGVSLYSGNNLSTSNNSAAGVGLVAAQDGISLSTSSAPGITGYVVAGDLCSGDSNSVQGTQITYSPSGGFPGPAPIQVTRELELP